VQYFARFLANENTGDDDSVVENWCIENHGNKKTYQILSRIWAYNPLLMINTSAIYAKFRLKQSMYKQNAGTRFLYYALRVSAIIFLLVCSGILANKYLTPHHDETITVYQEVYVPKGNRTSLILPDSSKVWLSNGSKLKYPNEFDRNQRELELKGEAYFEVKRDVKRPFIVGVGKNRIQVLGTKFSVTAYPEDNIVRADLISGKIRFEVNTGAGNYKSYEVQPSHSMTLDKTSGKVFDSEIQEGFYNYWQNGIYKFNNESLESLAKKIDRIYNIQIVFEDGLLKSKRFSGVISMNDNIFTLIEAIKRTSLDPVEYRYDKNKIYIKLK